MKAFDFEFKAFEQFAKRFGQTHAQRLGESFLSSSTHGLANYVISEAKTRTPVGSYGGNVSFTTRKGRNVSFTARPNRTGGLLRRSWHSRNYTRTNKGARIEVVNDASVFNSPTTLGAKNHGLYYYAESVEYGYTATTIDRIPEANVRPVRETPVQGQYMLTQSLDSVEQEYYPVLQAQYVAFLKRYLGE